MNHHQNRFIKLLSSFLSATLVLGILSENRVYAGDDITEPSVQNSGAFSYAVFAGSLDNDLVFNGWKCNITGDIYSGRDFVFQGSELNMNGCARTAGIVQPSERKENMTVAEEGIEPLLMPMWGDAIKAYETRLPSISPEELSSQDSIDVNGYFYSENDITINGTSFSGDVVIVSKGNITYNVCSLNTEGKVILYSEEGDININGTQIGINGILYAPQGRVTINAYDVTINGRIVADKFSYSGSILNITADPSDLTFIQDITEPTPDITPTEEPTQAPTEEPTETPSPTEEPTVSPSVTTVPTEEPTVEPTDEPTVEPTEIPTTTPVPTVEPTPTDIPSDLDTDRDGITDVMEAEFGTDPENDDTDGDGISDLFEILTDYDPLNIDSDGNGIEDGDEDLDGDGIDNKTELLIGTVFSEADSDRDGLDDKDEIDIYGTDPLSDDTDKDGISDGDEIRIGKDPLDISDKDVKVSQVYVLELDNCEDPALSRVEVRMDLRGYIYSSLSVQDTYDTDRESRELRERVGSPVSFDCIEDFDSATITFFYDETLVDEENLGILWHNEEDGCYILQEDAMIDRENNTITLTADHFSTYLLVDLNEWNDPIRPDNSDYIFVVHDEIEYSEWAGREKSLDEEEISSFAWWKLSNGSGYRIRTRLSGQKTLVEDRGAFQQWNYKYVWLVEADGNRDDDGIPDDLETSGMLGTDGKIYYSDPSTEHSDNDELTDAEEMGPMYYIVKTGEHEYNINGHLIDNSDLMNSAQQFDNDIDRMNCVLLFTWYKRFLPEEIEGVQVLFFVRSDPEKDDTDNDGILDDVDPSPRKISIEVISINNPDYVKVDFKKGQKTYGSNQSWIYNEELMEPVIGKEEFISNFPLFDAYAEGGCGTISAADLIAYIAFNWKGCRGLYPYETLDFNPDYANYLLQMFSVISPGLIPLCPDETSLYQQYLSLGILSERYYAEHVVDYAKENGVDLHSCFYSTPTWTGQNDKSFVSFVENGLKNNCPVALFIKDFGFNIYSNYSLALEKSKSDSIIGWHWVNITSMIIDYDNNIIVVKVSSWGQEYYLRVDDLMSMSLSGGVEGNIIEGTFSAVYFKSDEE